MELFSNFVANALAHPALPGHHRYLIVDTAATRPANIAAEFALRERAADILTGEPCVWGASASPVLLELPTAAAGTSQCRKTRELLAKWRYAICFVYLESCHARAAAIRTLRERTEAMLPQRMPVLLRYFDSRVFLALLGALSKEQAGAFLSAGMRWATSGRRGELHLMNHDPDVPSAAFIAPIEFDTAQEAALIDAGEADAMVDLLLNQGNAVLQSLLPPEQHERINAALKAATTLGIDQLGDQTAYCSLALELGPGFHEEVPWTSSLPEVRTGRLKFANAIASVLQSEG